MANNSFDRTILNPLERPLADDLNQAQSQIDRAVRGALRRMFQLAGVPQSGFLDTGLEVVQNSPAAMSVLVKAGIGFQDNPSDVPTAIGGIVGLDDRCAYKPLPLEADMTIAVDAAPGAGQERYDIVEVVADRRAENPSSRDVLNVGTGIFAPGTVNKTLAFYLDGQNGRVVSPANSTTGVGYKVGIAAAVGTAAVPATSPGYIPIATIYVGPSVTSILQANITDRRTVIGPTPGTGTVGTAQLAAGAVTRAKEAAVGQQVSASCGNFSTTSGTLTDVTNLSVSLTTTGRPVVVFLVPDGTVNNSQVSVTSTTATAIATLALLRDAAMISQHYMEVFGAGTTAAILGLPPGCVSFLDTPSAGAHTYKLQAMAGANSTALVQYSKLVAYEL